MSPLNHLDPFRLIKRANLAFLVHDRGSYRTVIICVLDFSARAGDSPVEALNNIQGRLPFSIHAFRDKLASAKFVMKLTFCEYLDLPCIDYLEAMSSVLIRTENPADLAINDRFANDRVKRDRRFDIQASLMSIHGYLQAKLGRGSFLSAKFVRMKKGLSLVDHRVVSDGLIEIDPKQSLRD